MPKIVLSKSKKRVAEVELPIQLTVEAYDATEPGINSKGKKRMAEDEVPLQLRIKVCDSNEPKINLESDDTAPVRPSQTQEDPCNNKKIEKLDSAVDERDSRPSKNLRIFIDINLDADYAEAGPSNTASDAVLKGEALIQSFPNYVVNVDTPVQWISNRSSSQLCKSTGPRPIVLDFWIKGCISKLFLNASRLYNDSYTVDLEVTDDVLGKLHEWMKAGPYPDKAVSHQNPLRVKARYVDVAKAADAMEPSDLPGVHLPLHRISDYPLIFDGVEVSEESDRPKGGENLGKLDDQPFVAMLLQLGAYKVNDNFGYSLAFQNIYILGDKAMWEEEMRVKGCGMLATSAPKERSRKFGSQG